MTAPPTDITHHTVTVNSITLHYAEAGDPDAPLVVLLHGFPEFWYSWRRQLSALAAAGYRVVAPDMRGYNLSDKPASIHNYRIGQLVADVGGLVRALGYERAVIAGHDWGGVVAWYMPMCYPEMVERLIVLNAPHPARYRKLLRTSGEQFRRSWYVLFFQLPWLPELALRARNFAAFDKVFTTARPNAFTVTDLACYKEAARQPGALPAMINYYRALGRATTLGTMPRPQRITCPTLLIWGMQDTALARANAEDLERHVADLRVARLPSASHWVQADAPDQVNALMLDFLGAGAG